MCVMFLTAAFCHLDAGINDIVRIIPRTSISPTKAAAECNPWYCSGLVIERIRKFHDKYAALPTDDGASECFRKYRESLRKYLQSNNLCDHEEYTGNAHFGYDFCHCILYSDLGSSKFLFFQINLAVMYL